jgi:hypothetical protein
MSSLLNNLGERISSAVSHYWKTRENQTKKQATSGRADQGLRSAVTGGAQMDGFISLLTEVIVGAGVKENHIYHNKNLELPGFFRPTKEWDLLVVKDGQLIMALEAKSQVGPSFGNNFNNRTEEAMGSALDLWTAYREGAFNKTIKPWIGYIFLLEDCKESRRTVSSVFCRNSRRHRMRNAMSFFAGNLLGKGITTAQPIYCQKGQAGLMANIKNRLKT